MCQTSVSGKLELNSTKKKKSIQKNHLTVGSVIEAQCFWVGRTHKQCAKTKATQRRKEN